jgi:hypothetical protein
MQKYSSTKDTMNHEGHNVVFVVVRCVLRAPVPCNKSPKYNIKQSTDLKQFV